MDTQNLSAPPCAQPLNPRGVTHINVPHTTRFTVVGNHLAQHRRLSLTAIGLARHIQSLPDEARVDIKTLADRFTEGETRIAAALRELKAHGYLAQVRKRLPNGRVVTHTVSYNRPQSQRLTSTPSPSAPKPQPRPAFDAVSPPQPITPEPSPSPRPQHLPPPCHPPPPNPRSPSPRPRTRSSSAPPPLSSPRSTTTTPASSSPSAMSSDSPPLSLPGWNALRAPPPGSDSVPPPPMVNCDGCDRGFRTWEQRNPRCRDCREAGLGTHGSGN